MAIGSLFSLLSWHEFPEGLVLLANPSVASAPDLALPAHDLIAFLCLNQPISRIKLA